MTQEQFENAVADFEALIIDGSDPNKALAEAANSSGMNPDAFESRLTREIPIGTLIEQILRRAGHDTFLAMAKEEVEKCSLRSGRYSKISFLSEGAEVEIAKALQERLGRPLDDHEIWLVGETFNPWLSDVKLQFKTGLKAIRKSPLRNL